MSVGRVRSLVVAMAVIAGGAVTAVVAPPAAATPTAPDHEGGVTGTYSLLYEDSGESLFEGRAPTSPPRAVLDTSSGVVELATVPSGLNSGDRVRVASDGRVTRLQAAPSLTSGASSILVVPVEWSGNGRDSTTRSSLVASMTATDDWYTQVSGGRLDVQPTVRDWTTVARPSAVCNDGTNDFAYDLRAKTITALRQAGVDVDAYAVIAVYFARTSPQSSCAWAGLGGGSRVWLAGYSDLRVVAHEIGHTLGLGHASLLRCTSAGSPVSLSGVCTGDEYGDPTDIMGASTAGFGSSHLDDLGWLGATEERSLTVPTGGSTTGSYSLVPLSRPGAGLRALEVTHPDGSRFWIEQRKRVGVDAANLDSGSEGIVVRFLPAPEVQVPCEGAISSCSASSFALEMDPALDGGTVPIGVGRSWESLDHVVRVAVAAGVGEALNVTISLAAPAALPVITAVETGRTGTTIRWSGADPRGGGGDAATSAYAYVVDEPWIRTDVPVGARSAVLSTPSGGFGRKVSFRVAGYNLMGPGAPSAPSAPRYVGGQVPFGTWDALVRAQRLAFTGSLGTASQRSADVSALDSGSRTPAQYVANLITDPYYEPKVAPVARLYRAYFRRLPDHTGLAYWAGNLRAGRTLGWVSQYFARSAEFTRTYGSLSDRAFVQLVYANVLGRAPDPAGADYWTSVLASRKRTRGQVMVGFSESVEYRRITAPIINAVLVYDGLLARVPTDAEVSAAATRTITQVADDVWRSPEFAARVGG